MHTDVLVVGAGPAGLATAVSALRHGARVLVVERRASTSSIPRATGVGVRSMELMRIWGVADAVRAGQIPCTPTVTIAATLADEPIEVVPINAPTPREAVRVSPAYVALCPQDHLEPVLLAEIRRLGGRVRFGTEVTDLQITPDGVRAGRVRARYVVGADGPRSTVRAALGIGWERLGTFGAWEQVLFRAAGLPAKPSAISFLKHPDAAGVLLPMGGGRWAFARKAGDRRDWVSELRIATGIPALDPEIIGTYAFEMAANVAATYRAGPGFLVGDAAHRMTPMGGTGMNTALQDGHELGWRLGWAASGLAGDALLASYATEREPVGRANALRTLNEDRDPLDGLPRDLGGTYRSPVIAANGPPAEAFTARPGQRAPHVWLRSGSSRVSTIDLFDGRLTLVTAAPRWARPATALGGVLPLEVSWAGPALQAAYRLGADSAVLVRPDGVVAWRRDAAHADHATTLVDAIATALGRADTAALAG